MEDVPGVDLSDLEDLADQYCFSKGFGIIHTQSHIMTLQNERDLPILRSLLNTGKHTLKELIKSGRLIHPVEFGYIESINKDKIIGEIEKVSVALKEAKQKLQDTEEVLSAPKKKIDEPVSYVEDDEMARMERAKGYRNIRERIENHGVLSGTTDFIPPSDDVVLNE